MEFTRHCVYVETDCLDSRSRISRVMPKLWDETIEAHRAAVRDATLDTTAALVAAEKGLASVTMSRIAKVTGIGRATSPKYFPDVEAILMAWHQRQVTHHLAHLAGVRIKLAARLSGWKRCSKPSLLFPMSAMAASSPRFCTEVSTSPRRSSISEADPGAAN